MQIETVARTVGTSPPMDGGVWFFLEKDSKKLGIIKEGCGSHAPLEALATTAVFREVKEGESVLCCS